MLKVYPTCEYPAQWDDFIDQDKKVIATIYTLEEGMKDNRKEGITKAKMGPMILSYMLKKSITK